MELLSQEVAEPQLAAEVAGLAGSALVEVVTYMEEEPFALEEQEALAELEMKHNLPGCKAHELVVEAAFGGGLRIVSCEKTCEIRRKRYVPCPCWDGGRMPVAAAAAFAASTDDVLGGKFCLWAAVGDWGSW